MTRILDGEEQRELDFSNQQGASSNESLDPSNTGEYTTDDADDKGAVDPIKVDPDPVNTTKVDPDPVDPDPVAEKPRVGDDVNALFDSGYDPREDLDNFIEENYYDDDPMGEIGITSSTGLTPEQAATIQKSGYTGSLNLGDDPNLKLAAEQGDARAVFNSFGKMVAGTFGEIIATPGYISEAVEDWRGTQDGYSNILIEAKDEIMEAAQDFAPVYLDRGDIGTLDVLNGEWWASHIEQLGPTMALLAVGLATDGLLTPTIMRGFAATAKGVNDLKLAQTILSQGSKVNTKLRAGVSATTSRLMEGTMEAYQVQQASREKYRKEGKSEEEAIALSSEDAKQAMTANMALVLMDAFQFNLAFKGLAGLSAGAKALHGTKNLAINMATEAIEEGIQHIITEKSIGEQSFSEGRAVSDIVGDEEFTKAMESGAFGGVVFAAGGPAINKATESIRYASSKEYRAKVDKMKEKEEIRLESVRLMEESYKAMVDGKVNKSEYLNDKLFDKTVLDALNNGTEDSLSQSLNDRLKLSDDELSKMGSKSIMGLDVTPREFLENKKEVVDAIIAKKKELQDFYGRDSENADISNDLLNAHMSAISMSNNLKFANKHKAKLEAEAAKVTSKNSATLNEAIEAKDKYDGLSDMIDKKTEETKRYNEYISKLENEESNDEAVNELKARIRHEEILLEELILARDNTKKTVDERKKLLTKEEKTLYSNHMPGKLASTVANIEALNYYNNLAQAEIKTKSKPEYRNKKEIEQADMMFQQLNVESELIQARKKFSNKNKKIDRLLKNRIDDIRKEKEGNSTSQQRQKAADAINEAKEAKERIRIAEEEAKKQKVKIKNRAQAINSSSDIFTNEDIDGLSDSSRESRNAGIERLNASLEDELTRLDNLSDEDFSRDRTTRAKENSELEKRYAYELNIINSTAINQTINDSNNLKKDDTATIDYFNEKKAASLENAKRGLYIDREIRRIHDEITNSVNTIESEIQDISLRIANNKESESDIQDKALLTSRLIEAKEALTEFEKVKVFDLIKEYYLNLSSALKEEINKREQQKKIQNEKLNNQIAISKTMSLSEDGNHYTNESGDLYDRQSNYVREKRNNTEDLKNNSNVINSLIGGNIIDSIGRDVFSNSGKTRSKKEYIAEALEKHEKEYGKKKFTMSDKHFDNIVKMITDYKNSFPEGTKFYSNDITVFKDYAKPKVNSKGETIKGVAGVIDLLVQTPDGNFHIVDFKSQQIKRTKKSLLIFKNKFKSKAELSNEVFNNPFNNEVSQLEKWGDQQTVYEYLIDLDIESINIMLIPYGYSHDDSGIEVLRTYDSADILDINEDNSSDISDNIIKLESSSFIGDNFENDFEKIYEPKDTEVKDTEVKDDPSKGNDLKPANEGDTYSIKVTNKKTKEEVDVNVIFSDGQWRKQKTNGKPYAKALPQAKQDFINEKRRQEELASELDASEQQTSEVTAEMWNTFVDTGKVPQDKVNDIANKIKLGNTLSDKELAIRTTYAKEIEKLLSQPTQQASEVVKSPLEGVSDSAIAEMSDENYKELVETGYTTWLGKNGETNDAAYKPQQTKQTIEVEVVVTNKRYSRKSLDADPDSMYLFTDNAERTSRPTASSPNITEGWYAEKYKDKTNKPLHYGSTSNPTSAVIRGKNNAYPVSTMSAYGTNWTNKNFDLFKDTIDDEIAQIKQDLPKFKTLKLGDFRIGQGGRFAKLPSQHQSYLDSKLLELGIDNSGSSPKVIQPAQQSNGVKVKDNQSDASIDGINNIPENTKPSFKRNAASKLAKILQSRRKDSSSDFSFQSIISELKDQVPGEYISIQEFVDIINESNPNLRISMDSVNNKFIVTKVKKDKSKDKDTTNVNSTKKDTTDTTDNINDRSNDNNSTVLDIHNTVTSETNSLDNVYTSSTAKATAKASADQMALKGLDDSDLKVKEDEADYTKIAYRVKDWNNKIKEDANLDMLDFNKVNVGTEVTFELADDDGQVINIYVDGKRKKTTWGKYSEDLSKDSDDYLSNLPIKILVGGKQVAYVPVYTQRKGDTAEYTESFIRFRANIISSIEKYGKDAVSSSIVSRTYGKLNLQNEASSVLDNMPDVEIGIYTSNGFSGVHSSISEDNITNSGILTYGHYYALTPADVGEYTAIPITPKKINKNIATAIAMAADVFISRQHTSQSTEVLNKMGSKYDLTTRSGVNNYIRLFTYPISAENSGKAPAGFISQFEKEVYDKDTNFNAISIDEFGISWAQGSQKSKENPAASNKITKKDKRNDKQYAKKMNNLIAHLQLMYHQMDTSVINDKFPKGIVLLRGKENGKQRNAQLLEVREEGIARTITYREMIQRLYVTNVKADLIGNEDGKDKYSYRFQSVMHLDENIKIKDLKTNEKTTLLEVKRDEIKKKKKKKKKKKGTSKAQKQKDIDIAKKREALANALTHAERTSVDDKADRTDQMALTNTESTVVLIDGLTAGTQRELILSIAESFARKIFKGKTTSISKDDETRIYNEWKSDLNILMEISTLDINSLGKYSKLKKKDKLKYSELKANIRRLNAAIENFDTVIDMTMNYLGSKSTMTVRSVDGEMTRSDKAGEMIKKQLGDSKTMESTGKHTMSAELKRFLHFVKDYKFEDGVPVVKKNWVGKDMYMPADKAFNTLQSWIANKRPNYKEIMSILEDKTKKHPWVEGFIEMLNNASEKNKREFIVALNNHSVNMDFVMWSKTRDEYKVRIYSDNFNSLYREKLSEWNNLMRSNLVNVVNSIEYYDTNKVEDIIGKINRLEKMSKNTPLKNSKAWEVSIDVSNFLYLKEIFEDIGIEVVDDIISAIVTGNYYSKGKRISFINQFKGGSLLRSIRNNIIKTLNKEEGTDKFESYGALDNSAVIELAKVAVRDIAETGTTSFRVDSKPIQGYTNNHFLSNTFMDLHDGKLTEKLEKFAYNKYSSWIEYMRSSEGSNMFNFRYISLNPLKQKGSKNKNSSSLGSRVSKEHEVIKLGMFHNAGQMKKFIHIDEDSHRTEKPMRNAIYFYSTTSDKSKVMLVNGIAHDVFIDTETRIVKEETVDHIINTIVASEIARIGAHQNTDFNHKGYDEGKNLFLIFPLLNNIPNIRDNDGKLIKDVLAIPGMRDQFRKVITEYVASQVNSKLAEWDQMGIAIKEDADNANTYTYIDSGYVTHAKTKVGNDSETIRAFMANDFVINNLFAQHNFSTIVQGDVAQYYKQHPSNKGKSITDESYNFEKDSQETYENLGKRLAGDVAPGYETYNSDEAPDIRMGLLEDRLSKSEVYEYLKSALKLADSDSYGKIESADAQEFTTWKEHLTVMYNTGKIEEVNYKRMMKSNGYFDDEDLAIILQPMKPVYVGNVLDNQVWRRYYIKSSSFPLLPQLTKGLQLDKLRMAMESQNVDRVAFGTSVKVGNVKTPLNIYVYKNIQGDTISDKEYSELPKEKKKEYFQSEEIRDDIVFELDKNVKLLPRKHMRIQQDIPYDGKKNKVTHSGQVAHNVFVNVQTILQQNPETAGLFKEFNSLYGELHNYHMASFLEKMEYKKDGSYDKKKLQEIIVKEAIERNFSINDKIGLGIVERVDEQTGKEFLDFEKPIWDAVSGTKMESLLMSLVDNKVRKLKFPGMSGVLGTEDGFSALDLNEYNTEVLEGDAGQAKIDEIQKVANVRTKDINIRTEDGLINFLSSVDVRKLNKVLDDYMKSAEVNIAYDNEIKDIRVEITNLEDIQGYIEYVKSKEFNDEIGDKGIRTRAINVSNDAILEEDDISEEGAISEEYDIFKFMSLLVPSMNSLDPRMLNPDQGDMFKDSNSEATSTKSKPEKTIDEQALEMFGEDSNLNKDGYPIRSLEAIKMELEDIEMELEEDFMQAEMDNVNDEIEEAKQIVSKQKGIIFTDKFKGKLQPMRRMSTNDPTRHATEAEMAKGEFEILPAQIICKNIIRDKRGNTVDILNFVNDNNILDTSKIPSEILELFGFRIPNQAHSSMSYIEIVGFLPTGMGDLIIAPKDFVTQMGSDFDVDKLYSYMRNHIAQKGTDEQIATLKELYKRANKNKEEIQRYNNRFNEENIDDLREDLLSILEKENIEVIANENIKFSSLTKEEKNKKVDKLKELMQTIPLDEIKKINKTGWKKGLPLTFRNEYPNTNERELKELFKSVLQYYNLSYFGTDEYPILAMKLDRSIAFDEINSLKPKMIWEVSLYKGEDISKELENKIIDIHFKILKMNNLEVQKLISEPLSFGAFKAVDPNKKDSENNPVVDLGNEIQDARDARKDLNLVELPEDLKLDPLGYSLFISNMKRAYENEYGVDLEYDESISQLQNEEKIEKAILNYEGTEKNIETIIGNVSISMEAINQYEVDKLFIEENQLHKAFKGVGDSSLLNRLLATAYKKFAKEDFLAHPVGFGPKSFLGISESYQKRKYLNGTAGKRGIATFSNAGILNAAAQGKEIKISKLKLDNIKFGDLTITGDVAGTRDNYLTINESGVKKYISEVISAIQSAAVDNENERILEKINAHPSILNTINGMLLLGLDEQAIVSIISQDAVIDFIREYTNMTSSLNSNAGDPTTEAINNVIAKYSNNIESRKKGLSTDKQERAHQMNLIMEEAKTITDDMFISELKEYIAKGPSMKYYDEVQISILYKFKRLMDAGDSIKKIIEITNTDSKGLPKSVIGAIIKRKQLMDLHFISEAEEGVRNADKLLGEFLVKPSSEKYDDDSLLKVGSKMVDRVRYDVFLKPTTIKGHSVVSSLNLVSKLYINDTVGHMFPYTSGMLYTLMDRIAAEADMNGVSLEASESFYQEIFSGLKSYLYTKALTQVSEGAIQNPSEERQSMLYDIKTSHRYETDPNNPNKEIKIEGEHTQKSFAYEMQSLKKHPVLKDLTIIQRIHSDIKYDGSASKLMFNATSQEDHDESLMYASFEELLKMNKNIEGKPYTTATLAMKLVKYAILTGGIQKATQFVKYIPNWYLKKIGFNKIIRETDFNSKETYGIEVSSLLSDFAKQFFQHNSSYTNQISHTDMTEVQGIMAGKNGKEAFDIKFPKNLRTAKQMYGKIQRFVVRPESPLSSYSYITVRLFNGDTNLFMKQEDGSYMRINKLGETGVLEYDATVKDAMSNYKKNGSADTLDKYERDIILDALDPDSNKSLNPISSDSIPGSGVIIDKKDPFNLNSNDINSVLTGVINNSKKPHIVEYAKELQKAILSKDENEEYVYDISIEAKNIQNVNGDSIIGQNIRDKKFFKSKVEINNTMSGVDDMMDVAIVHEMNHAVVGHWIDEYIDTLDKKGKKKLIKGNKEATRLLKRIHNFSKLFDERMKERHGDQKWEAIKEELMEGAGYSDKDFMNLEYAAKNLKEFAALATTSSRFRKYMNDELFKPEKKGKAGESLYDLFISLVKKLMKALNIDKNSKVGDLVYSDIIELTKLRPVQEKIKKTSKPKKSPTKNVERFKVTDVYGTSTEDFTDMAIDYDGKNYLLQLDSSGTILEAYRQINGELINVDLSYFTFNKDEIGQIFSEIEEIKKDKSTDQMALIQDPNDMNEGRPRKRVVGSDDNRIIDPNESGIGNPNNNRMIDPNETYGNNNNRRKKKESLKLSDEDIEQQLKFDALKKRYLKSKKEIELNISNNRTQQKVNKGKKGKEKVNEKLDLELKILYRKKEKLEENIEFISEALKVEDVIDLFDSQIEDFNTLLDDNENLSASVLARVRTELDVIIKVGTFEVNVDTHPLLNKKEMKSSKLKSKFITMSNTASEVRDRVTGLIEYEIRNNMREVFNKPDLTLAQLKGKIKDVSSMKGHAMGLSRMDDTLVSGISKSFQDTYNAAHIEGYKINQKVDSLIFAATPYLKKLNNKNLFHPLLQLDRFGEYTGKLITPFSDKYEIERSDAMALKIGLEGKAKINAIKADLKWRKNNEIVMDPRKLFPTDLNTYSNYKYDTETFKQSEIDSHIAELKEHLGDRLYNYYYKKLEKKIKDFNSEYLIKLDNVNSDNTKDASAKANSMKYWNLENSPYVEAKLHNKGESITLNPRTTKSRVLKRKGRRHSIFVPRKFTYSAKRTKVNTGYYDTKFSNLEKSNEVYELYEYFRDVLSDLYDMLPDHHRYNMSRNSLMFVKNKAMENALSNGIFDIGTPKKVYDALYDSLINDVRTNASEEVTSHDDFTGKLDPKVRLNIVDENKLINKEFTADLIQWTVDNKEIYKYFSGTLANFELNPFTFTKFLRTLKTSKTRDKLKAIGFDSLKVRQELLDIKTKSKRKVIKDKNLDIGTIIKVFAKTVVSFHHKAKVQDINNLAVEMSNDKNVEGDQTNLLALLNYSRDVYFGLPARKPEYITDTIIYTKEEKVKMKEYDKLIKEITDGYDDKDKANKDPRVISLINERNQLGQKYVPSGHIDQVLRFVQFKSMAWNLGSGVANMTFGTMANFLEAVEGRLFNVDQLLDAYKLVLGNSSVRNITFNKVTSDTASKIRGIMDGLDLSKDASDELSKASNASSKNRWWSDGFQIQKRTEYVNQATIMIAVFKNKPIKDVSTEYKGDKAMWEAFDKDGNWNTKEFGEEPDLASFSTYVDHVIAKIHGNYNFQDPILLKKYVLGRAVIQFKTWMIEGVATRFEETKDDEILGIVRKGRYRTVLNGAVMGNLDSKDHNPISRLAFLKTAIFEILNRNARVLSLGKLKKDVVSNSNMDNMTDYDAANLKAAVFEFTTLLAFTKSAALLIYMLTDAGDDDPESNKKKSSAFNFILNNLNKAEQDIWAYTSWETYSKIGKTVAPAAGLFIDAKAWVVSLMRLLDDDDTNDTFDRGPFRDENKALNKGLMFTPGLNNIPKMRRLFADSPYSKEFDDMLEMIDELTEDEND